MNRFAYGLTVPADAVDVLGHTNNVEYVRWVQDAAVAHSRAVGMDFEAYRSAGGVFVVRRHTLEYLRPSLAGDALVVTTWPQTWGRITVVRRTEVSRAETGERVLEAETTWAWVAMPAMRPARIPDEVRRRFEP